MKLQTKLSLILLSGLLLVYLGSCFFQRYASLAALKEFAQDSEAGDTGRQWQWAQEMQQATAGPLMDAMAGGDMDKFDKILASQRSVPGLQELSLYGPKGTISYSSDPAALRQHLPPELTDSLLAGGQLGKRLTDQSFEIYQPLRAEKDCVTCHTDWKPGRVCGVMSMRFSSSALREAEQSWVTFRHNFERTNAETAGFTIAAMIVILGLLVSLVIHFQLTVPLKRVAAALYAHAAEVTVAAGQVSASSNAVAEGATEQAASLQETSASLTQMAAMTRANADHTRTATELACATHTAANQGSAHMAELDLAIQEINASSDDISKIIKTINEIAFQTNILALNAAVEAARAGQAGMGFAVVADEVRNLAQRSAESARETESRIARALANSARCAERSRRVADTFKVILANATKVNELDADVVHSSEEQSHGIAQINTAVSQMDQVTQSNAASAEESAAAAEELTSQSATLRQSVGELLNLFGAAADSVAVSRNGSGKEPTVARTGRVSAPLLHPSSGNSGAAPKKIHPAEVFEDA